MRLSLIAAMSLNRVIGRGKDIPWHLPDEQQLFRHYTLGHSVIMGRVTYESIGKALDGRQNIVVTRQSGFKAPGCLITDSLDQAIDMGKGYSNEVFVIGGEGLFRDALPMADRIYLTTVEIQVAGDRFFPEFDENAFTCVEALTAHGTPSYTVRIYDRVEPVTDKRRFLNRFAVITCLMLITGFFLNRTFPVIHDANDYGRLIYGIIMIIFTGSALASGKFVQNMSYLGIWFGIFVVCLGVYSYRIELSGVKDRILTELVPSKGIQIEPDSMSFPVSTDGHYYIQAQVNGVNIEFLADTGASHIVLTPDDALKLGIDPGKRIYDRYYETANGTVRGSSVRLKHFIVGGIHLSDVSASVNEAPMRNSLLGMTFFDKMSRYEVKNNILTLYWKNEAKRE